MVATCCVIGCTNRFDKDNPKSFYRIPKKPDSRRNLWNGAIKRGQWEPRENDRVCFRHFITGVKSNDQTNPDYVPSVDMGYDENQANGDQRYARYQRLEQRQNEKQKTNAASALLDLSNVQNIPEPPEIVKPDSTLHDPCIKKIAALHLENEQLYTEMGRLQTENANLNVSRSQQSFENQVMSSERKIQFYTGVHSKALFMWLLSFVSCTLPTCKVMSPASILLCILMKLRLNLQHEDLAYRFNVSKTTVSDMLNQGLPVSFHF